MDASLPGGSSDATDAHILVIEQEQEPTRRRKNEDHAFLALLRKEMRDVTAEHIITWLNHHGISPDQIRKETNPAECERLLEHVCDPISACSHVRPPTPEEVRRFLFQKMKKDPIYIREFKRARNSRLHHICGDNPVHNNGTLPTWPEEESLERLILSLVSKGITLKTLQYCDQPLKVAEVVLPTVLSPRGNFTSDSKREANRLLANIVMKPKLFIDDTLKQLTTLGLRTVSKRSDRVKQKGEGESSSSGTQEPRHDESVPVYQPDDLSHARQISGERSYPDPLYVSTRGWQPNPEQNVSFGVMHPPTPNVQPMQGHDLYSDASVWLQQNNVLPLPHPRSFSSQSYYELLGSGSRSYQEGSDLVRGNDQMQQQHPQYVPHGAYQPVFSPYWAPLPHQQGSASSSSLRGPKKRERSLVRQQQEANNGISGGSNFPFE